MFKTDTWEKAIQFVSSHNNEADRRIAIIGEHQSEAEMHLEELRDQLSSQKVHIVEFCGNTEFTIPRTDACAIVARKDALAGIRPTHIMFEMRKDMRNHDNMFLGGYRSCTLIIVIPEGISTDYLNLVLPLNPITF